MIRGFQWEFGVVRVVKLLGFGWSNRQKNLEAEKILGMMLLGLRKYMMGHEAGEGHSKAVGLWEVAKVKQFDHVSGAKKTDQHR
ncbi:hypothetical protein P3S67_014579 [Capsicum chacoense]